MQSADLVWTIVSFLCTIFIFTFILGDNPVFRITSYLFVGITAGFIAVVLLYQVIIPKLIIPVLFNPSRNGFFTYIPLLLSILLLGKLFPRYSKLGNISMGFLVGTGAAVMVGGAVNGTIINQSLATIDSFTNNTFNIPDPSLIRWVEGLLLLIGTLSSLIYFQFSAKKTSNGKVERSKLIENISSIGGIFIAITFGALFVGVYSAALITLISRLDFIILTIKNLIPISIFF